MVEIAHTMLTVLAFVPLGYFPLFSSVVRDKVVGFIFNLKINDIVLHA